MTTKRVLITSSLSVLIISVLLLATGSSLLTKSFGGIPLGNLTTWAGFIALQLSIYWGHSKFTKSNSILGKIIKTLIETLIVISFLWLAIAYILSGNINFTFKPSAGFQGSNEASNVFWNINYCLVIAPIVLASIYNLLKLIEIRKERLK